MRSTPAVLLLAFAAACAPRMQPVRAVQPNGATVPSTADESVGRAHAEGRAERERAAAEHDQTVAHALQACAGAACDAIARGELAVGLTREQVLAATHTSAAAWEERGGGFVTTLTPRDEGRAPRDAVAEV